MNGCNEMVESAGVRLTTPACAASGREFAPIRIWLVDDNPAFRDLLASLLADEGGFECERQFSSPTAVLKALAGEAGPDILLLDIEMGEYNGLDAIQPIKSLAKDTHVLMLTTFAAPGIRERAFREGASDFMLKTWPMVEIAAHIRQAMEFGSVAGLLTTFLGQEKPVELKKDELVEKSTLGDRWLRSLRGWFKFSPSQAGRV